MNLRPGCGVGLFGLLLAVSAGMWGESLRGEEPATAEPLRYEEPRYLTGSVYTPDKKKLLFRFKRVAARSGSALRVERDFTYPDGRLAVRQRVVYEGDGLMSAEVQELQIGAEGKATVQRQTTNPAKRELRFEYTRVPGTRPKVRTESLSPDSLVEDMVVPFLLSHWEAINGGEKVKCRCIVVPREETIGFTFVKEPESKAQSKDVVLVRMEPSSPLVGAFVSPLFFTLEKAPPHRVLQYAGRTTPKLEAAGKWKDLDAVTVFDWGTAR